MISELSTLVTNFFVAHLASERNASQHTIYAYRDAMKLLLCFAAAARKRSIDRLTLEDLSAETVLRFLRDLEHGRHNSIRTRNARLAAIHSFYHYVLSMYSAENPLPLPFAIGFSIFLSNEPCDPLPAISMSNR